MIRAFPSAFSAPLRETVLLLLLLSSLNTIAQTANPARDLVNPFIGTGGHGHTFPGACVPNGLVQLSPDTRPDGYNDWDGCGGYHYSDSLIYGFSHAHLSGTGVADLCDVLLMPMSDEVSTDPNSYSSRFTHASESANAGYYRVYLLDDGIEAELTATARVGMHRYSMGESTPQNMVIDLRHRDRLLRSSLQQTGPKEISGWRRSSSWARDQQVHFVVAFDKEVSLRAAESDSALAIVAIGTGKGPLLVKVGISAVSIEGARANIEAEVPHWDFDLVRKQAEDAWNAKLNKIQVKGGTPEQQRIFYTALYHSYVAPYVFNDADGNYRGMDGQVHHADHNVYTVFSLWDTFRALHPLMTILEPDMTNDFIKTFQLQYEQGGRLPVWELWGNETDCMIGYHSASVIADAHAKGIRDYDEVALLKAMIAGATRDEPGLNALTKKGYISSEDQSESVSKTLEYAYDDRCIGSMASEVNIPDGALDGWELDLLNDRGQAFESLFDPATGFFRARRNGGFVPSFDPFEVNFNYTEANAWQYSLFAPQDFPRLIELHGGDGAFERHLDNLFTASTATSGREQADITGLIGQYAHGNEPSHHMAYLYNHVGKPEKTRAILERILNEQYHDAPDGLSGNEDCGQMSAWYVMSALGLYQVSPGISTEYDLGYPLFEEANIDVGDGKRFTIAVRDSTWKQMDAAAWSKKINAERAKNKKRIRAEQWEAPPMPDRSTTHFHPTRLDHSVIAAGGLIIFDSERMAEARPIFHPTVLDGVYIKPCPRPGAPVISARRSTFTDSLSVTVVGCGTCTLSDGSGMRDCPMNEPFTIRSTTTVNVKWSQTFEPVTAKFTRIDGSLAIKLGSTYANQYAAGGDNALVDGMRGGPDFRTGEWQGYQGQDVLATIDLGKARRLKRVGLSMLQDSRSWIWYPEYVDVAWSSNGRTWSSVQLTHTVDRRSEASQNMELWSALIGKKAQYIKIMAKNLGPCPEWHLGKGGASWLFLDEVMVEAED